MSTGESEISSGSLKAWWTCRRPAVTVVSEDSIFQRPSRDLSIADILDSPAKLCCWHWSVGRIIVLWWCRAVGATRTWFSKKEIDFDQQQRNNYSLGPGIYYPFAFCKRLISSYHISFSYSSALQVGKTKLFRQRCEPAALIHKPFLIRYGSRNCSATLHQYDWQLTKFPCSAAVRLLVRSHNCWFSGGPSGIPCSQPFPKYCTRSLDWEPLDLQE